MAYTGEYHYRRYLTGDTKPPPRWRMLSRRRFLTLMRKIAGAAKMCDEKWNVNSGYRSYAEQARLYALYKAGKGNLAAPPGRSRHNYGGAADLSDPFGKAVGVARKRREALKAMGLCLPVVGEKWHVEVGDEWQA